MAKRGRRTKYTPELEAEILKLLADGCIIADICSKVGISQETYFQYIKKYPEFSEKVERAKAEANVGAVQSMRLAMMPHDIGSRTIKVVKETRLRKVHTEHGISEVPYEWIKSEQSETKSNEFDWRAALEFLKRRDPDNWSEKLIIRVEPDQLALLKDAGFESAAQAFQMLIDNIAKEKANSAISNR